MDNEKISNTKMNTSSTSSHFTNVYPYTADTMATSPSGAANPWTNSTISTTSSNASSLIFSSQNDSNNTNINSNISNIKQQLSINANEQSYQAGLKKRQTRDLLHDAIDKYIHASDDDNDSDDTHPYDLISPDASAAGANKTPRLPAYSSVSSISSLMIRSSIDAPLARSFSSMDTATATSASSPQAADVFCLPINDKFDDEEEDDDDNDEERNDDDQQSVQNLLKFQTRPWTLEEDTIVMEKQKVLGNNWVKIAECLQGRTRTEVKTRFKSIARASHKLWSLEEDSLLFELYERFKGNWGLIADNFPNRTRNAVKVRYKELVQLQAEPESLKPPPLGSPGQIFFKRRQLQFQEFQQKMARNSFPSSSLANSSKPHTKSPKKKSASSMTSDKSDIVATDNDNNQQQIPPQSSVSSNLAVNNNNSNPNTNTSNIFGTTFIVGGGSTPSHSPLVQSFPSAPHSSSSTSLSNQPFGSSTPFLSSYPPSNAAPSVSASNNSNTKSNSNNDVNDNEKTSYKMPVGSPLKPDRRLYGMMYPKGEQIASSSLNPNTSNRSHMMQLQQQQQQQLQQKLFQYHYQLQQEQLLFLQKHLDNASKEASSNPSPPVVTAATAQQQPQTASTTSLSSPINTSLVGPLPPVALTMPNNTNHIETDDLLHIFATEIGLDMNDAEERNLMS